MTSGPAAIATRHPAGVEVLAAREHRVVRLAVLPVPAPRNRRVGRLSAPTAHPHRSAVQTRAAGNAQGVLTAPGRARTGSRAASRRSSGTGPQQTGRRGQSSTCSPGRGHASLLAGLDARHSKPRRDTGHPLITVSAVLDDAPVRLGLLVAVGVVVRGVADGGGAGRERGLLLEGAVDRGQVAALLLAVLQSLNLAHRVRADDKVPARAGVEVLVRQRARLLAAVVDRGDEARDARAVADLGRRPRRRVRESGAASGRAAPRLSANLGCGGRAVGQSDDATEPRADLEGVERGGVAGGLERKALGLVPLVHGALADLVAVDVDRDHVVRAHVDLAVAGDARHHRSSVP